MENTRRVREIEVRHICDYPEGEKLEVREILYLKGLSVDVPTYATKATKRNHENWIALMIEGEYGFSGVEPHPLKSAIETFNSFLVAGLVPLMPFLISNEMHSSSRQ